MSLWTAVKEFFLNVEDSWSARDKAGGQPAAPSGSGIVGAEREPDGPDLQLRLLDLASFKNYLGDEWPKQSAKVMNLANRILDHRLGTREFSTPVGESALLLGLRAFSEDAASLRASFLRDEVTRTLFGSKGLDEHVAKGVGATLRMVTADALGPSTNAEALSSTSYFGPKLTERLLSTDAVSDISRDTDSMLLAVADRAEREITQMDKLITAGGDVHAQGDVVSAVLDNLRTVEASLNDAESAQTDAAAESGPAWRGTTASVRDLISKLAMDAEDRLTALPPRPSAPDLQAATAEARPGLAELKSGEISSEFHYTPMWYVPSGALGMYRMRMSIRIGFEQATSDTLAQFSEDQDLIAVTDRLLFKRSMDDLAYAISIGRASAVCVPVNYLTLNWPRAQRLLLDQCKQLTPSMRRLIVWELIDVPVEAWQMRLRQEAGLIGGYGRATFLRVRPDVIHKTGAARRLAGLRSAGVRGIGVDFSTVQRNEADAIDTLNAIAEICEQNKLQSYAFGLNSMSMLTAALGAGVTYLGGDAVAAEVDQPLGLKKHEIERIFISHLQRLMKQ